MRKRVVVVSAVVALVLAGGVVATSAAAAGRSDSPNWSRLWWPSHDGDSRGSDVPAVSKPFADRGATERPVLDEESGTIHADRHPMADRRPAAHAERPARRKQAAKRPRAAERPLVVQPRRAVVRQKPVRRTQPQRQQRPATTLLAGARQTVTARDVSASPASPVQQRVLALINQNRRRAGCAPLTLDRRLIEAANVHASDMARRRYFDHESPRGKSAGDRVRGAGYRWTRYGENIARGADSPWQVVNGWMNSRPHRANILDCRLREMGVGLAISRDRTPYWVQDFATPQS